MTGRGAGLHRLGTLQVGRNIGDILIRQRPCLRMHGRMRALAVPVLLQRGGDVLGGLMAQLRHFVVRIGVSVILDSVATVAGIKLLLADGRVAGGARGMGQA